MNPNIIKTYCDNPSLKNLHNIDNDTQKILLELVPKVLKKYPEYNNIYHRRALQILELFDKPPVIIGNCEKLKGLVNTDSSCYLDSALFSLFALKNDFIDKNILYSTLQPNPLYNCVPKRTKKKDKLIIDLLNREEVQKNLVKITESLRDKNDIKYCTYLRSSFKNCPSIENYYKKGEKDVGEFLAYILKMFDVDKAVKRMDKYMTSSEENLYLSEIPIDLNPEMYKISEFIYYTESIIQFIDNSQIRFLDQNEDYYISKFITVIENIIEEKAYDVVYTKSIISSPYIIFDIGRVNIENEKFMKTKIIPSQTLTIESGNRFQLSAIVIWKKNHYTNYFKCNSLWYYYDDTESFIKEIGTYEDMLKSSPSAITNGKLYFYVSI